MGNNTNFLSGRIKRAPRISGTLKDTKFDKKTYFTSNPGAMAEGWSTEHELFIDESPLYFFYDCETTGLSRYDDEIIEVAALLYTRNLKLLPGQIAELTQLGGEHFQSLCHCAIPLTPVAADMTGLTPDDLQDQPLLEVVLQRLFDWIAEKISKANSLSAAVEVRYFPVLVAHNGCRFDFPFLMTKIKQLNLRQLDSQLTRIDLHFADTLTACGRLKKHDSESILTGLSSLRLQSLYTHFFPNEPYEGHRALADARMIRKLFTDTRLAEKLYVLRGTLRHVDKVRK